MTETDSPRLSDSALRRLVGAMPKAELHLHLDGALRIDTALELARTRGIEAPTTYAGMFSALVAPEQTPSQASLLQAFALPVSLMQDAEALERVTTELVEAKASDRVRYCEVKWAPALHTQKGLSLRDGIAAVCRGAQLGESRTGTMVRLVCVAVRSDDPARNIEVAEAAGAFLDGGLVGFDLAGLEEEYPDPLVHMESFRAARAAGLRVTVHAGELHDEGQGLRRALELAPERVAHGVDAMYDPTVCKMLRERGVTLDLCPTSNVQAASVPSLSEHPVAQLWRAGVPVTISTDDPTISDISLTDEYLRVLEHTDLSLGELWQINRHAIEAAFLKEDEIRGLLDEFDRWASLVQELRTQLSTEHAAE